MTTTETGATTMTTTLPTTPTVTLAYAMADRGLPFLATDGQHYAYGETAERALAELASVATPDPMADQTTWTNMSSAGTFAAVAIGDRFKFAAYGASYVKLDRWRYQLVRHEDGSPVPGMTYNVRERGTDTAVAP